MAILSLTISICVTREHLMGYIPFFRSEERPGPSPVTVNKILSTHSCAQHLHTVCGCFPVAVVELHCFNRDDVALKDKTICPSQKQFADPWFRSSKAETLL